MGVVRKMKEIWKFQRKKPKHCFWNCTFVGQLLCYSDEMKIKSKASDGSDCLGGTPSMLFRFQTSRFRDFCQFFVVIAHGSWRGPKLKKKHPSFLLMTNVHKLRKNSKNISLKIGPWGPKKLSQIFNMPIIKSVAQKGQNTPKSDFRGPKIPPRGAS